MSFVTGIRSAEYLPYKYDYKILRFFYLQKMFAYSKLVPESSNRFRPIPFKLPRVCKKSHNILLLLRTAIALADQYKGA